MCFRCYEEAGKPEIVNERTIAAAKLIDEVYEWSCAGGHLHIVVDDWNLEDENIEFCIGEMDKNSHELPPEAIEAERKCAAALMALSEDERYSAMAIHEEFIMI